MPDKFRVKIDNKLIDGTTQSGHWSKERHREKGDATEITSILLFNTSHVKGSLTELFFFRIFPQFPSQLNRFAIQMQTLMEKEVFTINNASATNLNTLS